jgi:hypothetical protein
MTSSLMSQLSYDGAIVKLKKSGTVVLKAASNQNIVPTEGHSFLQFATC